MKAIVFHRYGAADVLTTAEVNKPSAKKNEMLVRVHACEVTKADCELRSLNFPVKWFAGPLRLALGFNKPRKTILGGYIAGVVEDIGAEVSQFKVGDRIFGSSGFRFGGYGEYVCLPANSSLTKLSDNVSFEQAAGSVLGGLNALHFINLAAIKPGQHILINGAGGSIGSFAIQLAKQRGAMVTTIDAAHKKAMLAQQGSDFFIDYRETSLTEIEQSFDVVFNMVAGANFKTLTGLLTETGCFLTGNPRLSDMLRCWILNRTTKQRGYFAFASESIAELNELQTLLANNTLVPVIDACVHREDIVKAHQRVEQELRTGAVVLLHPEQ